MNKRKEKKLAEGLTKVIANQNKPVENQSIKPGTYNTNNISTGSITSAGINTYPTTPNVYPFPPAGTTVTGNPTFVPTTISHEEVGVLAKELELDEDVSGTLMDTNGKRYSIADAMVKLLALVKALKPTYRECSDCGQENPHQAFDYICIRCRDTITKASMDE